MREIDFNGYIDDEIWFGDEITPDMFRTQLFGEDGSSTDDVLIRLHSYGGSCAAATRMYDAVKEYPGNVTVVISGIAASAATVVACAGTSVRMTPGSLYMIHNPATFAYGNAGDLQAAIDLLQTVKDSIINIYARKTGASRDVLSRLMDDETWLDANGAIAHGFVDVIEGDPPQALENNLAEHKVCAAIGVARFYERRARPLDAVQKLPRAKKPNDNSIPAAKPEQGVPATQLLKRLALIENRR